MVSSFPGRVTVRYRLPGKLVDEVDCRASAVGVDRAVLLGDLLAAALPEALAEAARERLCLKLPLDAATPPAGTDGVDHLNALTTQATHIVPPGDLINEDISGGSSSI